MRPPDRHLPTEGSKPRDEMYHPEKCPKCLLKIALVLFKKVSEKCNNKRVYIIYYDDYGKRQLLFGCSPPIIGSKLPFTSWPSTLTRPR